MARAINQHLIFDTTANAYPRDLALDAEHIYWAAACSSDPIPSPCTSGAIGRAKLDGTGVDQSLIDGVNPGDIAVDAEHIYWTWSDCDGGWGLGGSGCTIDELADPPGGIARANLDGTDVDQSFVSGVDAGSLAVDAGHIYWTGWFCEATCGVPWGDLPPPVPAIGRANLNGTGVNPSFIGDLGSFTGLAVDAEHIYWTGRATLGRANIDGTGVEPTFIGGLTGGIPPPPFWEGAAVDRAHLYWTTHARTPGGSEASIVRANLDGGGFKTLIEPSGDDSFSPRALAVDAVTDTSPTRVRARTTAQRTQKQRGKRIGVKVKVKAKERLTAKATGKIRVNPTYKLKPRKGSLDPGETKKLRLKPKKAKAKKIATALKRGEKATAKLRVRLTDLAGNRETERLRVGLKR